MPNILIINAHQLYQGISEGKLNHHMADLIKSEMASKGYDVQQTYIEEGYDINEEIEKHEWADVIITQSPVFWFATPWIYKKYIDEVFTAAYVQQRLLGGDGRTPENPENKYGSGGKMQGKKYMLSLTWNAPEDVFNNTSQELLGGKGVDDVFIGNTCVYKFCGADIVPPFSCHNVMINPDVENDTIRLKAHLARYF